MYVCLWSISRATDFNGLQNEQMSNAEAEEEDWD